MNATAIPAKPHGLALMLNWPRVRFTLALSILFGLMLSSGWKSGLLSVLAAIDRTERREVRTVDRVQEVRRAQLEQLGR